MNVSDLLDIPAELSAKARDVPGLRERLLRFIKQEVAWNEIRQQRFSPEARALVQRARDHAARRQAKGIDRAEVLAQFEKNHLEIVNQL